MARPITKKECLYPLCDRRRYKESAHCLGHYRQLTKAGFQQMTTIKERGRKTCNYIECDKKAEYGFLCKKHYKVVYRGVKEFQCSVIYCDSVAVTKKLCHKHEIISRRYQVSSIALSQIILLSDGRCGICGGPPGEKGLHLDHDRSCCNKIGSCGSCIRGLICYRCNVALAHIDESINLMQEAIIYLERNYSILHIPDEKHIDRSTTSWEHRWSRYEVGLNRYKYLEDSHNGRCAICNQRWRVMHIDHDHGTGQVRGALCRECNLYLGDVKDSKSTILSMIQYVKRYKMEMIV